MKTGRIVEDSIGHIELALASVASRWKDLSKKDKERWKNYEIMLLSKLEKKAREDLEKLFS